MKRISGIWEKIACRDSLYRAYLKARKGKRANRSCHEFERCLGAQIDSLEIELKSKSYRPRKPNRFFVYEPKKRLIEAPAFRDLVVQHALYDQVMPIFNRKFIDQNFACRKGYGTHKAADYVQEMLLRSSPNEWILKIDCRKFFYSINHEDTKREIQATH